MATLRDELTDIRNRAALQTARFDRLGDVYPIVLNNGAELDAFIKDRIRLWLNSWITSPLDQVIERARIRSARQRRRGMGIVSAKHNEESNHD